MAKLPQRSGTTWLGNIRDKGGAFVVMHDLEGVYQAGAEIELQQLELRGVPITAEVLAHVEARHAALLAKKKAEIHRAGIRDYIKQMLRATRKADATRLAEAMILQGDDFLHLVHNCDQIGLSHHVKHHEFLHDDRRLTPEDHAALASNGVGPLSPEASKANRKINQIFREREHRSVHLFANSRAWHCFFLSYGDVAGDPDTGKQHWTHGQHIHYLSHLWGRDVTREGVWAELDSPKYSLKTVHIRFPYPTGKRPLKSPLRD